MNTQAFLDFFRQAAPYIHAHRGKTFVIHFDADFSDPNLDAMLHDCALLQSLGVNLILVHGTRAQIDANLSTSGITSKFYKDKRITTQQMMPDILNAVGSLRLRIEAALSMGMMNSPMQDADVRVASGNFLIARSLGIIDGQDYSYTGNVRKINTDAINAHLKLGEIILLSPIGYAPTGESYNLNSEEVAAEAAAALKADKLIYISDAINQYKQEGNSRQLTPEQARQLNLHNTWLRQRLHAAADACDSGIRRVHLVERSDEGALLQELFTRDGIGIMVTSDRYDNLRPATEDDINSLLALIRPLEEKGILVPRPREVLEKDIQHYFVLSRDSSIIACAALYPYPEQKTAELACLAVDPQYRKHQRADYLLNELEQIAKQQGLETLFILTTQTAQWFEERGFSAIEVSQLPPKKQEKYNHARNSRPYLKKL
ncbi:amino-acid N-acetyltransferase [Suttonella ornithocola]|uniref:Amino-acid acetyltransferase n=1 Tax=Suttonella ornithocola TaxID=279832 RepID=A0A380MXM6_9GAMM|nr:amino-acid N-acetyltransferase [Suttonella ornithocola]SUO97309.1 Amino-acid acetyltransferase [Suttonella ornithocola]